MPGRLGQRTSTASRLGPAGRACQVMLVQWMVGMARETGTCFASRVAAHMLSSSGQSARRIWQNLYQGWRRELRVICGWKACSMGQRIASTSVHLVIAPVAAGLLPCIICSLFKSSPSPCPRVSAQCSAQWGAQTGDVIDILIILCH